MEEGTRRLQTALTRLKNQDPWKIRHWGEERGFSGAVDQRPRTTSDKVQDAQHDLAILMEGRPCNDTMSGEPFETVVTVILDGGKYRGCGKALR